ncbi:MAG: acetyl-CoA carboxylase biotin carboxyl carrier protein [Rhodospirillales bacterium]|nr:acetyl-CoA carboxylase biotin carboxyl carrier protein [Rhodospirillales bacterium]MCW8861421.1 acetyl-CoA carboxylase biotin carboxyl carrier protein [Rhodospirillales bacterium]MCW8951978.1 acetyl-CoA carboxylase biotin carboxyl carrier protein [Rhodospirillales bacterium]MCW9001327.1 acetyl-CoA carboxylase biotin carboxyl carrier protein [Rhodospirillales bacterium]MCW9040280.1 acetyl-CoA carboxylase biotin carboxyl carrier protein [Rhodospirillales bacterium]
MGKEFDDDLVRKLAELLDETGLSEIEYGKDDWHIRVARQTAVTTAVHHAPAAAPPAPAVEAAPAAPAAHPGAVKSPMVGVAYLCPEPGAPDFVKPGDTVTEGQTILLIEAMKVFNPIHAPRAGKVTSVLIENSAPVEYGEPLVIIE